MPKVPVGIYSKASFDSLHLAEYMQAKAVLHIREQFSTEDEDSPLSLDNLTFERLQTMLRNADRDGSRDELEARLAALVMPIVEQVIMGAQGQQGQQGQVQ